MNARHLPHLHPCNVRLSRICVQVFFLVTLINFKCHYWNDDGIPLSHESRKDHQIQPMRKVGWKKSERDRHTQVIWMYLVFQSTGYSLGKVTQASSRRQMHLHLFLLPWAGQKGKNKLLERKLYSQVTKERIYSSLFIRIQVIMQVKQQTHNYCI